jgi:SOS-response transcriptional repressor LexA
MKKHEHIKRGDPLTPSEQRLVSLIERMIRELGRGPTVREIEEECGWSRSGVIEGAHACRAKGALTWKRVQGRPSWKSMRVLRAFLTTSSQRSTCRVTPA